SIPGASVVCAPGKLSSSAKADSRRSPGGVSNTSVVAGPCRKLSISSAGTSRTAASHQSPPCGANFPVCHSQDTTSPGTWMYRFNSVTSVFILLSPRGSSPHPVRTAVKARAAIHHERARIRRSDRERADPVTPRRLSSQRIARSRRVPGVQGTVSPLDPAPQLRGLGELLGETGNLEGAVCAVRNLRDDVVLVRVEVVSVLGVQHHVETEPVAVRLLRHDHASTQPDAMTTDRLLPVLRRRVGKRRR